MNFKNGLNKIKKNYNEGTALMKACSRGHLEIVQELLRVEDIDVNEKDDNYKWSALMRAAFEGRLSIVRELLKVDKSFRMNVNN